MHQTLSWHKLEEAEEHTATLNKLLIVDDDIRIAEELKNTMSQQGWLVEIAHNGADGLQLLRNFQYDFILLDWNMPDATGLDVCRSFRAEGGTTPIIFLTARNEIEDKEAGLDAGGDDYLTKPFAVRELLARIRTVQRRPPALARSELNVAGVSFDARAREARKGAKTVILTKTEARLFEFFLRNANQFFTGKDLFKALWPSQSESAETTVRVHMKYLRDKLSHIDADEILDSVQGQGYILRDKAR